MGNDKDREIQIFMTFEEDDISKLERYLNCEIDDETTLYNAVWEALDKAYNK